MADYINHLLFGIYPYIALAVLAIGSIVRFDREPYSWRASSSQLLRRKQLIWGSVLFHLGVLVVFFGHLVGLLVPIWVFESLHVKHEWKQVLAVVAGGIAGTFSFIGATMLLHRRLFDARIRVNSTFADTGILVLLWLQLALGLMTIPVSLGHLDGKEMVKFMAWANGIFTFDQAASSYLVGSSPIFRVHIFLGLTIFLLFPFTRLVHMLSAPVRYLWRPGYQVVRSRKLAS
ncbi:respiratory nitrate reductase subunit gamma [Novosphingobium sp. NPDC080210]|uniref:respiratory nitrate reductase subunit gamma n=1 Tax=Novosphingobium sp. NPDC080210 TaxID=3390596 RepID=UPI003CFC5E8F